MEKNDRIWRKGTTNFYAVTWQLISSEAGQAIAQGSHQRQNKVWVHAVGQEKKGSAQAESKNPYLNTKCGPTFTVIDKT